MSIGSTPDVTKSKIRSGLEATCALPADPAVMLFEPRFQTDDTDPEDAGVEDPTLKPSGHQDRPLPGKYALAGSMASTPDADGNLPALFTAHRQRSAITDLGNGAYRYTIGRGQGTDIASSYTEEVDRDDGVRVLNVGTTCTGYTVNLANGSPVTLTTNKEAVYQTPWRTAEKRHSNPATGSLYLRGWPPEWLDRADGDAGSISLTLVDLYTDSNARVQAVWMARAGKTRHITGTWSVTASQSSFTGSGGAATTDLAVGDVIEVEGEYLTVATVGGTEGTDDDAFTTTENHTAGASAKRVVREYGKAAQGALFFFETRPGNGAQTSLPRWWPCKHSSGTSGGFMGDRDTAGTTVEAHLTSSAGIVAGTSGSLTGTVSVAASDATITGSGTAFLSELRIGDFVTTPGDTVGKRIISIASDTSAEADSNYTAVESAVTMTRRPIPTVALTGTISTAGTTALTGSGTAFDTELAVGSIVRTAGGEVRRIESITSATAAVVTRAFANTEAGVAGTTYYEFDCQRERATWSAASHSSGPFIEPISSLYVYLSSTTISEELVEIAESVDIEFTAGKAADTGIGRKWAAIIGDEGQSTGTATIVLKKLSAQNRKAILAGEDLRARIVLSTGKAISTSPHEYTWEAILHMKLTGKPGFAADTSNNETLTGALFENSSDADGYTDALQWVVTSDRSNPFATS